MPPSPSPPHPDVRRWLAWLMAGFGDGVLELRVFPKDKGVLTGYFRSPEAAAEALAPWDGKAQIYAGLNPRIRQVWRQAPDMLRTLAKAGSKATVKAIHHVLIDFDPARPQGVPSSREEVLRARDRAKAVADWLAEQGASEPLAVMSGNGFHLLYKIPPQDSQAFPRRLQGFLREVARRFGGDGVDVDQKVWDAPRIVKVGGTISVKGTPSPNRPHRRSCIVHGIAPEPDEGLAAVIQRFDARPARASPPIRGAPAPARGADPEAVAQLVAPYWTPGNRHTLALGLAGMLAKAGWPEEKAADAVAMAARAAGDEEEHDRLRAVEDTYRGLFNEGKDIAGAALLEGVLPPQVFAALTTLVRASRGRLPKVGRITATAHLAGNEIPPDIQQMITTPPRDAKRRAAAVKAAAGVLRTLGWSDRNIRLLFARNPRAFPPDLLDDALSHGGR